MVPGEKGKKGMKNRLLVDDEQSLLDALSRTLERAGYRVETALNGRLAMELLSAQATDLVITDLIMPEKEGIDLIMFLKSRQPNLPIIAISGGGRNAPENYLSIAKALGAKDTLAKPFLNSELLKVVEHPPEPGLHPSPPQWTPRPSRDSGL